MNINKLLDSPEDIILDYYVKQLSLLKVGVTIYIDFAQENSSFLNLVEKDSVMHFFYTVSKLLNNNYFSKIDILDNQVLDLLKTNSTNTAEHVRAGLCKNIPIFVDDLVEIKFQSNTPFKENNLLEIDRNHGADLLRDIKKAQDLKLIVELTLKVIESGPTRLEFEEQLNSSMVMKRLQFEIKEKMKIVINQFKNINKNFEIILERLHLFNLHYRSNFNLLDPKNNLEVQRLITENIKLKDVFDAEKLCDYLLADKSNQLLLNRIEQEREVLKKRLNEQYETIIKEGLRYGT